MHIKKKIKLGKVVQLPRLMFINNLFVIVLMRWSPSRACSHQTHVRQFVDLFQNSGQASRILPRVATAYA